MSSTAEPPEDRRDSTIATPRPGVERIADAEALTAAQSDAERNLAALLEIHRILTGRSCRAEEASTRAITAARVRMAAMTASEIERSLRQQLQQTRVELRRAHHRIYTLEHAENLNDPPRRGESAP